MSDPLDVHRRLEHCLQAIQAGREAMAHDMHDAAMRLGAAEMMLASASYAVHKHAAARPQAQAQPDTSAEPGSQGALGTGRDLRPRWSSAASSRRSLELLAVWPGRARTAGAVAAVFMSSPPPVYRRSTAAG